MPFVSWEVPPLEVPVCIAEVPKENVAGVDEDVPKEKGLPNPDEVVPNEKPEDVVVNVVVLVAPKEKPDFPKVEEAAELVGLDIPPKEKLAVRK